MTVTERCRREALQVLRGELADRDQPIGASRRCSARSWRRPIRCTALSGNRYSMNGLFWISTNGFECRSARTRGRDRAHERVRVRDDDVGVARQSRHDREEPRRVERIREPQPLLEHVARRDLVHRKAVVERELAFVGDPRRDHGDLVAPSDEPPRLLARLELDPTHVRRPVMSRRQDPHVSSQLPLCNGVAARCEVGSSGAAVRIAEHADREAAEDRL